MVKGRCSTAAAVSANGPSVVQQEYNCHLQDCCTERDVHQT